MRSALSNQLANYPVDIALERADAALAEIDELDATGLDVLLMEGAEATAQASGGFGLAKDLHGEFAPVGGMHIWARLGSALIFIHSKRNQTAFMADEGK
jgi:hypothetical protein